MTSSEFMKNNNSLVGISNSDTKNSTAGNIIEQNDKNTVSPFFLSNTTGISSSTIPDAVISILFNDYTNGFRFDATALRLLSSKSGVEINENMQSALKQQMFHRGDGLYFFFEHIADTETRGGIVECANTLLDEFGCFEVPELYALYADKINEKIVGNADDFEKFYEQIEDRAFAVLPRHISAIE